MPDKFITAEIGETRAHIISRLTQDDILAADNKGRKPYIAPQKFDQLKQTAIELLEKPKFRQAEADFFISNSGVFKSIQKMTLNTFLARVREIQTSNPVTNPAENRMIEDMIILSTGAVILRNDKNSKSNDKLKPAAEIQAPPAYINEVARPLPLRAR